MKKIYGIIIAIAACVLCVCTFFAVRSKIQNQNELNNLEKEGAPVEDIEKLGHQARLLFDDELKGTQTDDEFMQALKDDINVYRSNDARINSFSIQSASDTKYTTFNNRDYASLQLVYYIREGSNLHTSGTKFTLRKDNSGKWKILYWELVDSVDLG